jgi:HSP90 family molecular chaperone
MMAKKTIELNPNHPIIKKIRDEIRDGGREDQKV